MGKGSRPRPISIDKDEFGVRWDLIFKKCKTCTNYVILPDTQHPHSFDGEGWCMHEKHSGDLVSESFSCEHFKNKP